MNDDERLLLRYICCDGDIQRCRQQARIILNKISSRGDETFKQTLIRELDRKPNIIELPANLRELLIAEDMTNFPESRFLLREEEKSVVKNVLSISKVAKRLGEMGISYSPSLMLYGDSGGGKTMLARYIAHRTGVPFVYVRFSSVVGSYLGSTQANIAKIFDYARTASCVLCFDEIDALGMARGQKNDVGEMNRIVISLMQEMDRLPNGVIVIGTTNRFDRIDPALIRRFTLHHEIMPMQPDEITLLVRRFFTYAGISTDTEWLNEWCSNNFQAAIPASVVIDKCTNFVVEKILADQYEDED